jgi:putative transcriptional regulator
MLRVASSPSPGAPECVSEFLDCPLREEALSCFSMRVIRWIRKSIRWITRMKTAISGSSPLFTALKNPQDKMAAIHDARARGLARALAQIEAREMGGAGNRPIPVDVAAVRKRMGMSQELFAARFGFSVATLRHWEHGDRKPHGAALVLLNVIARNPRAVLNALAPARSQAWPAT